MTTEDDDEITAVYPRAWARAIAAISLDDPEMWPDLEPEAEAVEPGLNLDDAADRWKFISTRYAGVLEGLAK